MRFDALCARFAYFRLRTPPEKTARFKNRCVFCIGEITAIYRTVQYGKLASAGGREARSEYVDPQQSTHIALIDDVLDRELGEHLEECIECLAQC